MKQKSTTFYCFSPLVMLATFTVEIAMLAYLIMRYQLNTKGRLISLLLVFLALFQLAEYNVCTADTGDLWPHIGYISITLLPALGMHLATAIAEPKGALRYLPVAAYAHASWWVGLFAFGNAFDSYACTSNYAVFDLTGHHHYGYFAYYYFWLLAAIVTSLYLARRASSHKVRRALKLLVTGYLVFLVPTTVLNVLFPETIAGIPSIMCGFAVLFAFMLTFGIAPLVAPLKKHVGKPSLRYR